MLGQSPPTALYNAPPNDAFQFRHPCGYAVMLIKWSVLWLCSGGHIACVLCSA